MVVNIARIAKAVQVKTGSPYDFEKVRWETGERRD